MAGSITPGPNNILLFASGKYFGFRKTLPLMAGIQIGFFCLLLASALGVSAALASHPHVQIAMKGIASLWLLYLAIRIARMERPQPHVIPRLITLPQAFFMQFINPKAWALTLNGAAAFMPTLASRASSIAAFVGTFVACGSFAMLTWVLAGNALARLFESPRAHRSLSVFLAVLLALSVVAVWW